MATKDPRVDAYIGKSAEFARPILTHLRKLVHMACPEVEETMKWSFPHFLHQGMMCSMASFKEHCAFGFWKGRLLFGETKTAGKVDERAMGHFGRITRLSDLPKDKVLLGYIREAAKLNEAGVKAPARPKSKEKKELVVPDYLAAALKENAKAQSAWDGFSYSHRKEYVEWVTEAKTEPTRQKRLQTTLEWLANGKSRHWKYANCG